MKTIATEKSVLSSTKQRSIQYDELPRGSPVKAMPLISRKSGQAGEFEDRVTADFMKLVDTMAHQRSGKLTDAEFRKNYRKKSLQNGA